MATIGCMNKCRECNLELEPWESTRCESCIVKSEVRLVSQSNCEQCGEALEEWEKDQTCDKCAKHVEYVILFGIDPETGKPRQRSF